MTKRVVKTKTNNPVAKFAVMFNRCKKMTDKRKAVKRGEMKHKRSEEVFLTFLYL